jgi:predicted double-glycine peptidase
LRSTDSARALVLVVALAGRLVAQPAPFDAAQGSPEANRGAPLQILDVPFISQSEALCGGAAAAMVLRYWGERGLTAESFAHLVDRSAAGIRTDALLRELMTRGWTAVALDGTDAAIESELQRGRPVLTLIEDRPGRYHYVVIVATTPDAVVFHDPARAPLRVVSRAEFSRRWQAAARWMAVVVPGNRTPESAPVISETAAPPGGTCEQVMARGVSEAQAGDLAGAERTLTTALACGGAAAMRELAGVRVLQQRWSDVEALSATATALDPAEPYGWRLLGTSRFVQNNPAGALRAWNKVGEPKLDLLTVGGLGRTRQRVVEGLVDARPGSVVTEDVVSRSERRLRELPSAASTSIELVPRAGGLAELRATIHERPLLPADVWSYAAIAARAASRRELAVGTGSLTGGGERLRAEWRFWPGRPRVAVTFDSPAPWGGIWSVSGIDERDRFTGGLETTDRSAGVAGWSNWITSTIKFSVETGIDDWNQIGTLSRSRSDVRILTRGSRVDLRGGVEFWAGAATFSRASASLTVFSSRARRGFVSVGRAGAASGSADLPPLMWFAGDTGQARETLLRAHPLIDDGRLRIEQMGRRLLNASVEGQRWWSAGLVQAAAAAFVDTARVSSGVGVDPRGDVDAGIGLRVALPGAGTIRGDVATGLRHGGTRWSFVYEP